MDSWFDTHSRSTDFFSLKNWRDIQFDEHFLSRILSKWSLEAVKNTTLCELHKMTRISLAHQHGRRFIVLGHAPIPYLFDYPPWALIKIWTLRVGANSRWALIRGWALIKFSTFSASVVCLFCNKTINSKTKREDVTKQGFCKILWRKLRLRGSFLLVLIQFLGGVRETGRVEVGAYPRLGAY